MSNRRFSTSARPEVVFFTDRDLGLQFPDILRAAGLRVERHADHFAPDCPDEEWLEAVGGRGWVAVTHDARIRHKPNELAAVTESHIGLLVVVGKVPHAELARSFVATSRRILRFLASHERPFIAKVYRPSPHELARNPNAPGRIELSWPRSG